MNKTLKILLGASLVCGIGCCVVYYLHDLSDLTERKEQKESDNNTTNTTNNNTNNTTNNNTNNTTNNNTNNNTNNEKEGQKFNVLITFDQTDETARNTSKELEKDLIDIGFENVNIMLSNNLSAIADQNLINNLRETRKDLTILQSQ